MFGLEKLNIKSKVSATGTAGTATTIWVKGSGMSYEDGFRVEIGGLEAKTSSRLTSKFKIGTPTTLSAGTYDIIAYNGDGALGQNIGTYTVK